MERMFRSWDRAALAVDAWLGNRVEPLTQRDRALAALLFLFIAATRLLARARTLWDWDETLFCLSLHGYDVSRHHPHPPGFPLYVAAAKLIRPLAGSDFQAFQSLNLLAGALLAPALFLLFRELRLGTRTSLAAAAITPFFPPILIFGGSAFSDVVSLTLIVAGAALLVRGVHSDGPLSGGALLSGVAIGVRTQNVLYLLVPLLLVTLANGRRRWKRTLVALILMAIPAVGAYVGAAVATGSWQRYAAAVAQHKRYIQTHDAWGTPGRPQLSTLFNKIYMRPFRAGLLSNILGLLSLAGVVAAIIRRERRFLAAALIFLPFSLLALLLLDHNSLGRFGIGYLPMQGLFVASALDHATRTPRARNLLLIIAAGGLSCALLAWTWNAARVVRKTLSPPVAAIEFIRAHYDPRTTTVLVSGVLVPHADYLLSDYRRVVIGDQPTVELETPDAVLLSDSDSMSEGATSLRRGHDRLWAIVRRSYFDVSVSAAMRNPLLLDGWYDREGGALDPWRWMRQHAVVRLAPRRHGSLHLVAETPDASKQPLLISASVGGRVIDRWQALGRVDRTLALDSADGKPIDLQIDLDRSVNYQRLRLSNDSRDLGLRLRQLTWSDQTSTAAGSVRP